MAALAHPSLTNSQLSALRARSATRHPGLPSKLAATLGVWRRRIRERRILTELTARDLADFGATTADVHREINTPFWR
jgi:uncharacterized protein YjiS (DUF1127 family)